MPLLLPSFVRGLASPPAPLHVELALHPCGHCGQAAGLNDVVLKVGPHDRTLWVTVSSAPAAEPAAPVLSTRQELGRISQRIKPLMGNVARRGMQYGLMVGGLLATAAALAAPIVGAYFVLPGVLVGVAVPGLVLLGLVVGAVIEVTARNRRKARLDVQDVLSLERTYLRLQQDKRRLGKLDYDETAAWHKVNRLLEELSGGLFRAIRLLTCERLGLKMRCGRYVVGSVLPQTPALLAAEAKVAQQQAAATSAEAVRPHH